MAESIPGVVGEEHRTSDAGPVPDARRELRTMDGYPHDWAGTFPVSASETKSAGPVAAGPFGAALAEVALTIRGHGPATDDDLAALSVITETAVTLIEGTEHAAVVVPAGAGTLRALAAHGELPPLLMGIQNELGSGPCIDAATHTDQILVTDLASDLRWPGFSTAVRHLDVRSMLCTSLALPGEVLGSLTLASSRPGAFDPEAAELAAVFAAHATLAVSNLRIARQLTTMAGSRDIIGQAKGILMERHGLTAQQAFATLVRVSQNHNVKLRVLCEQFAADGALPS